MPVCIHLTHIQSCMHDPTEEGGEAIFQFFISILTPPVATPSNPQWPMYYPSQTSSCTCLGKSALVNPHPQLGLSFQIHCLLQMIQNLSSQKIHTALSHNMQCCHPCPCGLGCQPQLKAKLICLFTYFHNQRWCPHSSSGNFGNLYRAA
jgi:hypothetical protein